MIEYDNLTNGYTECEPVKHYEECVDTSECEPGIKDFDEEVINLSNKSYYTYRMENISDVVSYPNLRNYTINTLEEINRAFENLSKRVAELEKMHEREVELL